MKLKMCIYIWCPSNTRNPHFLPVTCTTWTRILTTVSEQERTDGVALRLQIQPQGHCQIYYRERHTTPHQHGRQGAVSPKSLRKFKHNVLETRHCEIGILLVKLQPIQVWVTFLKPTEFLKQLTLKGIIK